MTRPAMTPADHALVASRYLEAAQRTMKRAQPDINLAVNPHSYGPPHVPQETRDALAEVGLRLDAASHALVTARDHLLVARALQERAVDEFGPIGGAQ